MASGRFLSTTIAIDPQLAQLSAVAELLYLKCIPHLDRDGMITGQPMALLGIVSPMRFSELQAGMAAVVDEWVETGLVVRFVCSLGPVLFFKGFPKQQVLRYDRERPSQFPCPPGYIRTGAGLKPATDVPWLEDSGDSGYYPKNPAKVPVFTESAVQQQQQQQQQEQQEQQQQQQGHEAASAPESPAAAALVEFGIAGSVLAELADCPEEHVLGWIAYARTQDKLRNPRGYVIKRLRSGEHPPALPAAAEEAVESYEALKRRYVPAGLEDVIAH
jgi:hypothetical protein